MRFSSSRSRRSRKTDLLIDIGPMIPEVYAVRWERWY